MVDTGAESTWINATALEAIGIERRKKDLQFQLANGQIITRSVGYAVLMVDSSETVDEVVFAEAGDLQLLGARALEGLNLQVDARRKRLVAAGPIVSAAAVPPRFGRLVQVPLGAPKARRKTRPKRTRPSTSSGPVTRGAPRTRASASDFNPIAMRGEPLSQTVLRQRK
jgi:predicted aspartyl protease